MKVVYAPCCVCGAPSTDRIRLEEDGKTVETRYYCQPCVEREWRRLVTVESLPCEDCGHTPCDCDQMRAAHELLYGGEEEAAYLSDDEGFDEPHGDECCCEDCLQDYPERDALYNDCQFYGVPSDGTVAMLCSYPGCEVIAEIIQEGEPIPAGSIGRKHMFCPKHEQEGGGDGA